MPAETPNYYTSLAPFRALFAAGTPCLTYHKLGPRPRGVRLKGLYVGERLFKKQLAELRRARFASVQPDLLANNQDDTQKKICLSFDDGFANALQYGLEPLRENGFRAIQFLVADHIGGFNVWDLPVGEIQERLMDEQQIKDWLAAGHEIGSHTLSHPYLTRIPAQSARTEIFDSKKKLEDRFGVPIRHFCYPYGDRNSAVRDLIQQAGYQTACTTELGVNTSRTSPFELKRFMARYQSLSLKTIKARLGVS